MQKQSARLYWRNKDHKDIWYRGHYHCALFKGSELIWHKSLEKVHLCWTRDNRMYGNCTVLGVFDPDTKTVRWNTRFLPYPYGKAYRMDEMVYVYGGYSNSGSTVAISDRFGSCYKRYQAHNDMALFPLNRNRLFMLVNNGNHEYEYHVGSFDKNGDLTFQKIREESGSYIIQIRTYGYTFGHFFVYSIEKNLYILDADTGDVAYSELVGDGIYRQLASGSSDCNYIQDGDTVYCFHYLDGGDGQLYSPGVSIIFGGARTRRTIPISGIKTNAYICGIKKNGRYYVYDFSKNTSNKYTSHVLYSDDFGNWTKVSLPQSLRVPLAAPWNVDGTTYTYIQIKFDSDEATEKGCLGVEFFKLFQYIKESSANAYYESGKIDDTKDGMMLGGISRTGIYANFYCIYLDNMTFQGSENNIAFWY